MRKDFRSSYPLEAWEKAQLALARHIVKFGPEYSRLYEVIEAAVAEARKTDVGGRARAFLASKTL